MRSFAPIAAAVAVATFAFAPAARAELECDGMQRSFTGEIQKVNDKQVVVDNKKGDKIKFQPHETTVFSGNATDWDGLKKGDWATVCSKMLEKPRYAYKIESFEKKDDED